MLVCIVIVLFKFILLCKALKIALYKGSGYNPTSFMCNPDLSCNLTLDPMVRFLLWVKSKLFCLHHFLFLLNVIPNPLGYQSPGLPEEPVVPTLSWLYFCSSEIQFCNYINLFGPFLEFL